MLNKTIMTDEMLQYILSDFNEIKFYKNLFERADIYIFCKFYRKSVLQLTLEDFAILTDSNMNTISGFENGRSKNFEHITKYYNISDPLQKEFFRKVIPFTL